jgi:MYXO-CTERM domain-containing protein
VKTLPLYVALLAAGSASAAQVWVAPAAQKIRPSTQAPAGAAAVAKIAAAKNEFEAFHVVVTGPATGVSMSLDALDDGAGHRISGRDLVLYREALINVPQQSGGDGAPGMWPDALIPDVDPIAGEKRNAFPFDVPANESRAVMVDVHAPQGTPAGKYTGTLHITGGVTQDVPVELTVWDFDVPSTSTLRTAFGMAWNGPCMGHGDGNCSGGDADMALRARYVQAALDNHVSIHQPYFTATVDANGNANWGAFDQYAGPFLDGTANTRLPGAKLSAVSVNGSISAPAVKGWSQHFADKGWTSTTLFAYICDEPPLTCQWSDIPGRVASVHAGDPSMPTLVTTTTWEAQAHGVGGIDLFVPVINYVEGKAGSNEAGDQRAKFNANTWWYQSCMSFGCSAVGGGRDGTGESGWPTYAVDSDGTRNRAMEWMSFTYDMTGELYYEMTMSYFTGDPWTNQTGFGGTGDGTLFYPGTTARIGGQTEIPVESLRLKGIRDGMEDYELLALAKKLGAGEQAKAIAAGLFPKTYQSTATPAALDSARAELAALILHALGKDTPADNGSASAGGTTSCDTTACTSTTPSSGSAPQPKLADALGSGGCSSSGAQSLWLALPVFAAFALRRRRSGSRVQG